ncbi:hypothetical protein [Pararhizobium haloflavum]|uniref:hypothetical protein n=1 Tax=Pararhizobium haloflavum TaxID=2037914 RepID=UPI000C18E965|nr:hypothetical protein [Pararhizobium haloflavum]
MSERVDWTNAEVADRLDWTRQGVFAQEATDRLVNGAISYPAHWARFLVAKKAAFTVTVAPGEYYEQDVVYTLLTPTDMDLGALRPTVNGVVQWVALLIGGIEEVIEESRAIQTQEVETGVLVQRQTPKIIRRAVSIAPLAAKIFGQKPDVPAGACCIALVPMTTAGVEADAIEPYDGHRVVPLAEVAARLAILEERVDRLRRDTDSIATDVSAIGQRLDALPPPDLFQMFGRDIARQNRQAGVDPLAGNYVFDCGLVDDFWDFDHPESYARRDHGLRFPFAAVSDSQLRLSEPDNDKIVVTPGGSLLPAYEEVVRIETPVGSGRERVANVVHSVTTATKHYRSHERTTYGPVEMVCENSLHWNEAALRDREYGEVFKVAGQEYRIQGQSDIPWNATETAQRGHLGFDVQQVNKVRWTSSYTRYHTEEFGLNNAAYAQTFRSSQIFMATGIDLYLTAVDTGEEFTIALGKTRPDGSPATEAIIETGTVDGADLSLGWQTVSFEPALIEQHPVAWTLATPGNNEIAKSDDNAFSLGTSFKITDGVYAQGFATVDYSFRVRGARFHQARTFIDFGPYELQGGIAGIDLVYQGLLPSGTDRVWAIKPLGATEWIPFDDRPDSPLANLPASVRLGCWFVGTRDVQPCLQLDEGARVRCFRLANTMAFVSKEIDFGFATPRLSAVGHVDDFDPVRGTPSLAIILPNGTTVAPDTFTIEPDAERPRRSVVKATWEESIPAPIASCRLKVGGTKQSALDGWFWQDIGLNAF